MALSIGECGVTVVAEECKLAARGWTPWRVSVVMEKSMWARVCGQEYVDGKLFSAHNIMAS